MLVVETVARIRREHFAKGKTIREIARDLGVSRNTVRKVLRSGETSFEYERAVQPRPKLGRWTAELDELLEGNAAKAAREQLTLIRIFEEFRGRGYDGGYDALRRYARRWAKQHGKATAAAYVPLSFAPGEAYQFDWSHEVVVLSGVTVIVKAAHVRLCHRRMLFVRAHARRKAAGAFWIAEVPNCFARPATNARPPRAFQEAAWRLYRELSAHVPQTHPGASARRPGTSKPKLPPVQSANH
jgi:transposase